MARPSQEPTHPDTVGHDALGCEKSRPLVPKPESRRSVTCSLSLLTGILKGEGKGQEEGQKEGDKEQPLSLTSPKWATGRVQGP